MKKLGLLLCLLLGLTACGQAEPQKKEEVFGTLEEAIETYEEKIAYGDGRFEEMLETEGNIIVAYTEDTADEEAEPGMYFVIFEETEEGIVWRKNVGSFHLMPSGTQGFNNQMEWMEQEDGTCLMYDLKAASWDSEPAEEELAELDFGFGEVRERDGYYFSLKMEVYWE